MQNLAYMKQGDNIFFYFLYAAVGMEHVGKEPPSWNFFN